MRHFVLVLVLSALASAASHASPARAGDDKSKVGRPLAAARPLPSPLKTGQRVAINPQPLPPESTLRKAINPQPLPPESTMGKAINPQPLPPESIN